MSDNLPQGTPQGDGKGPSPRSAATEQRLSGRAQRKLAAEQAEKRKRLVTIGGALAALALAALLVFVFTRKPEAPPVAVAPPMEEGIAVAGRTMGDPDAPVKVVEWGDYQCPGCMNFDRTVKPQIIEEYVKPGKVFFEFRDYAFLGVESKLAAQATECAAQQNQYWGFHDTIYQNFTKGHDTGAYSADRLRQMAEANGLDLSAYDTCMASDASMKVVEDSLAEGQGLGVNSTPSVFVNGQKVDWKGWDTLKAAIDAELAK